MQSDRLVKGERQLEWFKTGMRWGVTLLGIFWLSSTPLALAAIRYVWQDSPNPKPPYNEWSSAAHTIQDAIDVSLACDYILVTNGVYSTGGRIVSGTLLTNRVAVDKGIQVQSVNGPAATVIEGDRASDDRYGSGLGDGAIRCAYLGNGAILSGFTLTNGYTRAQAGIADSSGGGVWCETSAIVTNCLIVDNHSDWNGLTDTNSGGGGAYGGTLNNCTLLHNQTYAGGGGAFGSTLESCLVINNSCDTLGGGVSDCVLRNCVVAGNYADDGPGLGAANSTLINCTLFGNRGEDFCCAGGAYACTLLNTISYGLPGLNYSPLCTINFSCVTPLPPGGVGNIANDPLFIEVENLNFHLQSNSPCIDAGQNSFAPAGADLDGVARIIDGRVDMGAYEFHFPQSLAALDVSIQMYAGLTISAKVGTIYSIEYLTDLTQANTLGAWRHLEFLQLPASPYLWTDKSAPVSGRRFYRAIRFLAPTNMVFIPPGTFRMGTPTNEPGGFEGAGAQALVTISRGFWMGKYEVTQAEYQDLIGHNPSYFRGDTSRPVEQVNWFDARSFCEKLQQRELAAGRIQPNSVFRLPTEAEWEYACRGWTIRPSHVHKWLLEPRTDTGDGRRISATGLGDARCWRANLLTAEPKEGADPGKT